MAKETILTDLSPPAIIAAIEESIAASAIAYVNTVAGEVHLDPELTWITCGRPLAYYNGVFRTNITTSDPDERIETVLTAFREKQQGLSWWVTPATRPHDIAQRLEAHGLTLRFRDIGMAIAIEQINNQQPTRDGLGEGWS